MLTLDLTFPPPGISYLQGVFKFQSRRVQNHLCIPSRHIIASLQAREHTLDIGYIYKYVDRHLIERQVDQLIVDQWSCCVLYLTRRYIHTIRHSIGTGNVATCILYENRGPGLGAQCTSYSVTSPGFLKGQESNTCRRRPPPSSGPSISLDLQPKYT